MQVVYSDGITFGAGDWWVKLGDRELGDRRKFFSRNISCIYFHVSLHVICIRTFAPCVHSDRGFAVLGAMDSSEAWGEAIPLTETVKCNLSASEVYEYLTKAGWRHVKRGMLKITS